VSEAAAARASAIERCGWARRLGAHVAAIGSGNACVEADYRDEHSNTFGLVHGGVAASLALWAGDVASWSSQRVSTPAAGLGGRPLTLHISYLEVAREESLRATATVLQRGREVVHLRADVLASTRTVAQALMTYRIGPPQQAQILSPPAMAGDSDVLDAIEHLPKVSPFIRTCGIRLHRADRDLAAMTMPLAGNESASGALDEGALAGCIDTCAALACKAFHDCAPTRAATLSLSAAFAAPLPGDVAVTGRLDARDGEIFTTRVEAAAAAGGGAGATALVTYRFA